MVFTRPYTYVLKQLSKGKRSGGEEMRRTKRAIAILSIVAMLVASVVAMIPVVDTKADNAGYPDLLCDFHNWRVYSKELSSDNDGNILVNLHMEKNTNDLQALWIKDVVINGNVHATIKRDYMSSYASSVFFDIPSNSSKNDAIIISSQSLSKAGVKRIESIQIEFWVSPSFGAMGDVPIRNTKLTASQFKGNGVYNINGKNYNVLFGLVLNENTNKTLQEIKTSDGSIPMYRLYNPNSGEHFYTSNYYEVVNVVGAGWSYEQVAWYAPSSGTPVYRMYNPNVGDHHYTMNWAEVQMLKNAGWNYEGEAWKSGGSVKMLRAYNPNAVTGTHHYTSNRAEINMIVAAGWRDEGYGWYALR